MNTEQARTNMIKQQVKTWNVNDPYIIETLEAIPRENFVPERFQSLAYSDMMIPLAHQQCMLSPKLEAKMLQLAAPKVQERILEIGTGSGFFTALLAHNCEHVFSVELYDDLMLDAAEGIFRSGIKNITLEVGNATEGWEKHQPYDVIVITGALPFLPDVFKSIVDPRGRIIAILGDAPNMEVCKIERDDHGEWQNTPMFETVVPPLEGALQPERFQF